MADKWTEKQLDAIEARGISVMVSAAAGSGKTSVLVERLLRILSDGQNKVPADRIVVVTFTKDAAAQMKQRLCDAIAAQLEQEPDNEWLYSQQALIPSAKISTIHSFCFDLIRENVRSLDISAGFRIMDNSEEELIINKALKNVFEDMYETQPDVMEMLCDRTCGDKRSDAQLEEYILKIYDFLASMPFPDEFLSSVRSFYGKPFDRKTDPLWERYTDFISENIGKAALLAKSAAGLWDTDGKAKELLVGEAQSIEDCRIDLMRGIFTSAPRFGTLRFPKTDDEDELAVIDRIKKIRDEYKTLVKKVYENTFTDDIIQDDYRYNAEMIDGITVIEKKLSEEIRRIKCDKNALGFSDAEQLAVKLLCDKDGSGKPVKSGLAKELSEYYSLIMIDEFQDVNDTQNLIFRMLAHNGTADSSGDNLFAVGDVKQAIYRFRKANPQNFISSLESAREYKKPFTGGCVAILLNRNFRSSEDVVDFVNDSFRLLMTKDVGDVDYGDKEKLEYGASYVDADRATEIIRFDSELTAAAADDGDDSEIPEPAAHIEARAVAEKITSMLGKVTVTDKGAERLCEPRDFCVLLRDRASGRIYAETLGDIGVKAVCEETQGYLLSQEIMTLVSLLRIIDNPMQDIPFAAVLMSPIFMFTADEMSELRLMSGKDEKLYKAALSAVSEDSVYSAKDKLAGFFEIFKKLRIDAASMSLERLIRNIYDRTDFLTSMSVYADGERRKANLRLLLLYADSYERNSSGGISGFLRYLDDISDNGGDFAMASVVSASENAVSVKTMHKSKGLEYPFVFICGTAHGFNKKDLTGRLQLHLHYGAGFGIQKFAEGRRYASFPQFVISYINKKEMISEEMRLLYVAMTRAKEKLFITIPDNIDGKLDKISQSLCAFGGKADGVKADCMLDWILAVLLTHKDAEELRDKRDIPLAANSSRIIFSHSGARTDESCEKKYAKALPDEKLKQKLLDNFSFKYGDIGDGALAKLTITEIAKSEDMKIFLQRPDFAEDYGRLTAAEIGTATHTYMQYANFAEAEQDAKAQAEKLESLGIISAAEKNSIDYSHIRKFFSSDIYRRMKKSPEIRREQKFLIEFSEMALDESLSKEYNKSMLQGIADCMFFEDGRIVLVDYKTDRVRSAGVLLDRYSRQLILYAAALERIFQVKVKEAVIYSFCLDEEIKVELT